MAVGRAHTVGEAAADAQIYPTEGEVKPSHYGRSPGVPVTIHISCAHPIEEAARDLIERLTDEALEDGIGLEVRTHMGEVH